MGEVSQPIARIAGARDTAPSFQRAFRRGRRRRKFPNSGGLAFPSQVDCIKPLLLWFKMVLEAFESSTAETKVRSA